MERREFLKRLFLITGGLILSGCISSARRTVTGFAVSSGKPSMPKRLLGKTGVKLSVIGLGGIVVMNETPEKAEKLVNESIEAGINYFDVAPSYGDAELKLGPALKPWRSKVFLACKTGQRDKNGAWEELQKSLQRLQTDHIDLYQLHGLITEKDVETTLGKNGAIEAFLQAKKEGIIQYVGFSAHSPKAALKAMQEFDFDTILYPVNFVTHFRSHFEEKVLFEAKKRNLGILALKAMAKQQWSKDADRKQHPKCWYQPIAEPELAELALYWTLAQGITAILPPADEQVYRNALRLAPKYRKLTEPEINKLKQIAEDLNPIFSA